MSDTARQRLNRATMVLALVGSYFALLLMLRKLSSSFGIQLDMALISLLRLLRGIPGLSSMISVFSSWGVASFVVLAVVFLSVFLSSLWHSNSSGWLPVWRRWDISILTINIYATVFLSAYLLWGYPFSASILPLTLVSFLAAAGLITELVLRHKYNQLSWLWPKFFRFYPPSKPLGLLMSFLLAGNLTYLLIISFTTAVQRIRLNTPAFLFAVFSLSALTILAVSVLSLAEDYENATRERLRAERLKTELITNVSHDIRTPLTAIISYVDLLKQTNCSEEEYQGYVEVLARKAARLKTLLEDLMDASKAGSGNVTVTLQEIDLAEIVSQVASEFDDAYDERNLTLVLRLPEHPLPVMTDSRHLYRTLENLFSNAGRYSLPGTRVFAEIAAEEGYLVFTLKNTSIVPLDVPTSALTEQFIRGDRSRHSEGSGLGLYIAKSLIELMGGAFEIQVTGDLFSVEIRLLELHL